MRACSQWERVNGRLWLARASRRMFKTFLQWKPDGPEDRIGLRLWGARLRQSFLLRAGVMGCSLGRALQSRRVLVLDLRRGLSGGLML